MTIVASSVRTVVGRTLERIWLPAVLVVAWWFFSASSTSLYFPPLSRIWEALVAGFTTGRLLEDLTYSLQNLAFGLVIGTVLAIAVGIMIGELERLREILDPVLQFSRCVPQAALIPIVIGALGIGQAPKIYLIAFACFWPVLLNTIDGVRTISPEVRDMARAYRVPTLLRIRRVVLPAALPQIVAGIRVSLAVGVVIMVVSELFSAQAGIGHSINIAGSSFNMASAWAGTLLVGALGYGLSLAFILFERITLRWYFDSADPVEARTSRTAGRRRKVVVT
jgi:ABC-type nitrate/sulfonate/bicarbonate transport system permease component